MTKPKQGAKVTNKGHEPTETTRAQVLQSSGLGLPQESIAKLIGIDRKTLAKHYDHELKLGKAKAAAKIAGSLFNSAAEGNTTAQIFWLKTQMGWKETSQVEHSSPDGSMSPPSRIEIVAPDVSKAD